MSEMEKEFVDMINTHRGIIYKVCHLYGKEKDYRDDLFQEIVLQLWRSFPTFKHQSLPSTWMYRVALNTAISQFRKDVRVPTKDSLTGAHFQIPDVSFRQDENENVFQLHLAIQLLTRIEKALVMLYLEEKSYQEIGDIMGISLSNVGVRLNRIKTKLEKIIKTQKI